MRTAIPVEVKRGERIQQERDRIIAQAEEEAGRIVALAREDASKLTDEHEIIQAAVQRERTIIERAQKEADGLRVEADEYARGVLVSLNGQLSSLEDQVKVLLTTVRNGLSALSGAADAVASEDADTVHPSEPPVEDSIATPETGV
jgi:hypothetical protein